MYFFLIWEKTGEGGERVFNIFTAPFGRLFTKIIIIIIIIIITTIIIILNLKEVIQYFLKMNKGTKKPPGSFEGVTCWVNARAKS